MDRVQFWPAAVLISVLVYVLGTTPSLAEPNDRPNIIFLFTDDQRFDAMGFLHPVLETPNMDRLAEQGVYLPNAFVTTPVCSSSRATVLTGLHEQTHGFTFGTPPLGLEFILQSYPKLLRENGYTTGLVGKNGTQLDNTRIELLFDEYVPVNRNPYIQIREGEEIHATDYTAKKASEFIAGATEPFMLSVWFNAPHAEDSDPTQYIPPERYNDLYAGIDFPDPPTSDPSFFSGLPEFLQNSLNRVRWFWRWSPDIYDSMMSRYLAMIKGVDDAVGEILDQSVTSGVADRTIVILMSDNGYFIGERGFAGKWLAHEPSILTPFLIFDPRVPDALQGRVLPQMVLNIDLPETILEFAGIAVPETMQGRSLVPLIQGKNPVWREDFFVEHSFTNPPSAIIPQHESLRTTQMKYVYYPEHDYEELYDLFLDPNEEANLSNDPLYQTQLATLRQRTIELKDTYAQCIDSDDDDVCDGIDSCPDFDDSIDTDGDGIPDGCDTCPTGLILTNQEVISTVIYESCTSITASDGFRVLASGDVTFRSSAQSSLGSGFSMQKGAVLTIDIDPSLVPN